jgi:SAM-dependent methyltransferase
MPIKLASNDKHSHPLNLRFKSSYSPIKMIESELLENSYTNAKRELLGDQNWIYGPIYTYNTIRPIIAYTKFSVVNKSVCEAGCGAWNPAGAASLLFINGAKRSIAFDIQDPHDTRRSAEALLDLLISCLIDPGKYHFSSINRRQFLDNILSFNLKALSLGDLERGIENTGVEIHVADIYTLDSPVFKNFDLVYSRATLEHLQDLSKAIKILHDITLPGGHGFHLFDFIDHRYYHNSTQYSPWSFLCDGGNFLIGENPEDISYRMRPSEVLGCFTSAGFALQQYDSVSLNFPEELRSNLALEFRNLPKDDLDTWLANIHVTKHSAQAYAQSL